jgi:hypothetical protein
VPYWGPDGRYYDEAGNEVRPPEGSAPAWSGPPDPEAQATQVAVQDRPDLVAEPAEIQMPAEDVPGRGPAYTSRSAAVSERGFDPAAHAQVTEATAGLEGARERAYAGAGAEAEALLASQDEQVWKPALDAVATPEELGELGGVSRMSVERDVARAKEDLYRELAEAENDFAARAETAWKVSEAKIAEKSAQYEQAMTEFAAMRVDPGQFWGNLGKPGRFGALLSVFAHDFLGAAGIQTSAMSTLNRAIDQNIESQVANIKHQGQVVDGFRQLWSMAVQDSKTEMEAIEKMRGFHLAHFQANLTAEMAKYDAPMAIVRAQEANAKIMAERAANQQKVQEFYTQEARARYQQDIQVESMRLDAAHRARMARIAEREQALKEKLAEEKTDPVRPVFVDPAIGQGLGMIRTDIGTDTTRAELQARAAKLTTASRDLVRLNELLAKLGNKAIYQGPGAQKLNNEDERQVLLLAKKIAVNTAHAEEGKRLSDMDLKFYQELFPVESWLTRGGNQKILAQRVVDFNEDFKTTFAPFVDAPRTKAEAEAMRSYRGLVGHKPAGPTSAAYESVAAGLRPERGPMDERMKKVQDPGRRHPDVSLVTDPGGRGGPKLKPEGERVVGMWTETTGRKVDPSRLGTLPPQWASDMVGLVDDAVKAHKEMDNLKVPEGQDPDEYRALAKSEVNRQVVNALMYYRAAQGEAWRKAPGADSQSVADEKGKMADRLLVEYGRQAGVHPKYLKRIANEFDPLYKAPDPEKDNLRNWEKSVRAQFDVPSDPPPAFAPRRVDSLE